MKGAIGSAVLMTRGRSLYMRGASNANFTTMGFAGSAFVGGPNNLGNFYTVTVPGQTVTEVNANRFNAPSHAKSQYTVGTTGVTADLTKFITYDNVAVTAITFNNPGGVGGDLHGPRGLAARHPGGRHQRRADRHPDHHERLQQRAGRHPVEHHQGRPDR